MHAHLGPLIEAAHRNECSLAVFKPSRVTDFIWEQGSREWDVDKVEAIRKRGDQGELFADEDWRRTLKLIPRLPWKFSYRFEDAARQKSEMQVLDWETGQLFWSCLKQAQGDETAALTKVREKYLGAFAKKDLHFFLGTTQQYHGWATNPWVIIGVFPIPHERQIQLI